MPCTGAVSDCNEVLGDRVVLAARCGDYIKVSEDVHSVDGHVEDALACGREVCLCEVEPDVVRGSRGEVGDRVREGSSESNVLIDHLRRGNGHVAGVDRGGCRGGLGGPAVICVWHVRPGGSSAAGVDRDCAWQRCDRDAVDHTVVGRRRELDHDLALASGVSDEVFSDGSIFGIGRRLDIKVCQSGHAIDAHVEEAVAGGRVIDLGEIETDVV